MKKKFAIIMVLLILISSLAIAQEQQFVTDVSYGQIEKVQKVSTLENIINRIRGNTISAGTGGTTFNVVFPGTDKLFRGGEFFRGRVLSFDSSIGLSEACGRFWTTLKSTIVVQGPNNFRDEFSKTVSGSHQAGEIIRTSFSWTIPNDAAFGTYTISDHLYCHTAFSRNNVQQASLGGTFTVIDCPTPVGTSLPHCGVVSGDVIRTITDSTCGTRIETVDDCDYRSEVCLGSTQPILTGSSNARCVNRCEGVQCGSTTGVCEGGSTYEINGVCNPSTGLCVYETPGNACEGPESLCQDVTCPPSVGYCESDGNKITVENTCNPMTGQCSQNSVVLACNQAGRGSCQPSPVQSSKECPTLGGGTATKTCTNTCRYGNTNDCSKSIICPDPCSSFTPQTRQVPCPNGDVISGKSSCSSSTGKITQANPLCSGEQLVPPPIDTGVITDEDVCGNLICEASETCDSCSIDCGECQNSGTVCGDNLCDLVEKTCDSSSYCPFDCGEDVSCGLDFGGYCGDSFCDIDELSTCVSDCGDDFTGTPDSQDTIGEGCGDFVCQEFESCQTCAVDCGTCQTRTQEPTGLVTGNLKLPETLTNNPLVTSGAILGIAITGFGLFIYQKSRGKKR